MPSLVVFVNLFLIPLRRVRNLGYATSPMEVRRNDKRLVIFTDLDGTLLDSETYSWEAARPALETLRARCVPLILCSSKTQAEMTSLRNALGHQHPFVAENGGAVLIPQNYFTVPLPRHEIIGQYCTIKLGVSYPIIRNAIAEITRETGIPIRGYGDLTAKEIALLTGLSPEEAERAKAREYDEPFVVDGSPLDQQTVLDRITAKGFRWIPGGRFYHLTGKHDKGRAVRLLSEIYRRQHGPIITVGLGDNPNDLPMLMVVDQPILLQQPDGSYQDIDLLHLHRAEGIGPVGWNRAVLSLLKG